MPDAENALAGVMDTPAPQLAPLRGDPMFGTTAEPRRMCRSPRTQALDVALTAAKQNYKPLLKTKENPYFHSKYADLADVLDAIETPLAQQGIAILQSADLDDNKLALHTELVHGESGEYRSCRMGLVLRDADPQKMGSIISYLRRYALSTLAGVAAEDDDGNSASGKSTAPPPAERPKVNQAPAKVTNASRPGEAGPSGHSNSARAAATETTAPVPPADPAPQTPANNASDRQRSDAEKKEHNKQIRELQATPGVDGELVKTYIITALSPDYTKRSFGEWEVVIGKLRAARDAGTLNELIRIQEAA